MANPLLSRRATLAGWAGRGEHRRLAGHEIFTVDLGPTEEGSREPLLVLHGFPTCSFDFHLVVDELARKRRVLMLDMLGYGLSAKPDLHYSVELQADIVQAFTTDVLGSGLQANDADASVVGTPRLALLTHDMGDTVGGELLARHIEGRWRVDITTRIVTNGSIYIEMANLTEGQKYLLSLPDERLSAAIDPVGTTMVGALAATFSPASEVSSDELEAAWELIAHNGGDLLLPRLIRYIEDRRRDEARFTGAIESHPTPLSILWGTEDPIAVVGMATRLGSARPDSRTVLLKGVGHYPMLEAPRLFLDALSVALDY